MKIKRLSKNYMTSQVGRCLICEEKYHPGAQVFDCEVDGVKGVAHSLCDSQKYDMRRKVKDERDKR